MEEGAANFSRLLHDAALQGNVTLLADLLRRDPLLLHRSSNSSLLNIACKLRHLDFMLELLRLSPILAEELDPNDKSCPLHLVARFNGHLELVRSLVSINPSMCLARDMHGMTPVHVAAVKGHLHILDELLTVMPAAARERLVDGSGGGTIMHLCVKYNQLEALRLIASRVGDAEMLNAKDGDGNTVLHLAVANKQLEIVRFLLSDNRLTKNTPNLRGSTAMDIFKESHKDPKIDHQLRLTLKRAKVLPSEDVKKEKEKDKHLDWLENQRSAVMVVASLIATMAFQAGTNPPGLASQDHDNSPQAAPANPPGGASQDNFGKAIMALTDNIYYYDIFIILSTVGLVSSMSSIILLISGLPCRRFFMAFIMVTMWVAITAMTFAYWMSLYALMPTASRSLVCKDIIYSMLVWAFVMALLFLGHGIWWTVRLLKSLGRLLKKLFGYCF